MLLHRWFTAAAVAAGLCTPSLVWAQLEDAEAEIQVVEEPIGGVIEAIGRAIRPRAVPDVAPAAPAAEGTPADQVKDEPEVEIVRKPKAQLPPRHMLLKLQDGSTIAGELSVNEIQVTTEFGKLTIPVAKIRSFTPGLGSNSKLAGDLQAKLKDLESDDYKTREQAHKDLAAMGPRISKQLAPHLQSENTEVKRHVTEIMKEFEQLAEEAEDEEGQSKAEKPLINQDTIETTDFTVTGQIAPEQFQMASKYGPLKIALGDIVEATRPVDSRESIRRSVSVPGQNLAARSFKSTNIRLQAGDRVTITASGNIVMSPWGSNASSGPDGMPNYGWYVPSSIPGGALVYRIGDKGQVQKAGSRVTFTAKTSGVLQLAIGMMPEYSNEGYNFPGEYKAKIKVDPQ
jgi:hypothetical protein